MPPTKMISSAKSDYIAVRVSLLFILFYFTCSTFPFPMTCIYQQVERFFLKFNRLSQCQKVKILYQKYLKIRKIDLQILIPFFHPPIYLPLAQPPKSYKNHLIDASEYHTSSDVTLGNDKQKYYKTTIQEYFPRKTQRVEKRNINTCASDIPLNYYGNVSFYKFNIIHT